MAREISSEHPMKAGGWFSQMILMGIAAAAAREPAETRFEITAVMINAASEITSVMGEITPKQPAAVATPLPPVLNLR